MSKDFSLHLASLQVTSLLCRVRGSRSTFTLDPSVKRKNIIVIYLLILASTSRSLQVFHCNEASIQEINRHQEARLDFDNSLENSRKGKNDPRTFIVDLAFYKKTNSNS